MVVAARPPASLVGSYELLAWIVRTAATSGPDHVAAADRHRLMADHAGTGEIDTEGRRAVAAYHASVVKGQPISERKLAETFGKTSRRWARNRMAEDRQSLAPV